MANAEVVEQAVPTLTTVERKKCGAKTRSGRTCKQWAMVGRTRCRLHGGLSPCGVNHYAFKHGRYSKHIPRDMRRDYDAAVGDDDLTSLRDELALLTVRISSLLSDLKETTPPAWSEAVKAYSRFRGSGNSGEAQAALDDLERILQKGRNAARVSEKIWAQLREIIQERTRTASAEWKRLGDLQGVVTLDQAMGFARAFLFAAREVITDPDLLKALTDRTRSLLPPSEVEPSHH